MLYFSVELGVKGLKLPTNPHRIIAAAEPDNHRGTSMNDERNRAWRRFKTKVNRGRGKGSDEICKPEKKWNMMYLRKNKLARARQLGFDYPRKSGRQFLEQECPPDE